jgi:hypothetical protein
MATFIHNSSVRLPLRIYKYLAGKAAFAGKKNVDAALKQKQIASLKEGLKEGIAISKGEAEGNPISTLWDE